MMYKFFIVLFIIGIVFSSVSVCLAQEASQAPDDLNEAKSLLKRVLEGIPRALGEAFNTLTGALKKIFSWLKELFDKYLYSWLKALVSKIGSYLNKEVEKRKPQAQEEFKKEVEDLKEEVINEAPSLWQRFRNLIK